VGLFERTVRLVIERGGRR